LEKFRIGDSFSYEINVSNDVEAVFIEIPPALLQPYVENSIWQGLLNKEQGQKHLEINISKSDRLITNTSSWSLTNFDRLLFNICRINLE